MCCVTIPDDVTLLIAGAGVLLAAAAAYLTSLGESIASWPRVRGTVTISRAHEIIGEDGGTLTLRKLQYTYEVAHRRYVSSRVRFGPGHWHWSRSYRAHAESLAEGQFVTVWYHPRWPRLCTLQPRGTPGATVLIVAGVIYGVVILMQGL